GLIATTSSHSLELFVDQWRQPGSGTFPNGPDSRSTATVQEHNYRNQSGVQWQIDWSTWANNLRLDPQYGLFSASSRLQSGHNLDRMPDLASGWAEIEIDWPQGKPPANPSGYFGPMVGFHKEINREENLEVTPIGRGDGGVDLVLEAWVGNPLVLARWTMPTASIGGTSIPEPGDIIRVRWQQVSSTSLTIRASYYDASATTWYNDIISGTYNLSSVADASPSGAQINYLDGNHGASSITIDSQYYAIRRYKVGTLDTYP